MTFAQSDNTFADITGNFATAYTRPTGTGYTFSTVELDSSTYADLQFI